jgi:membrane protein implicated in regulation of membrane protease activity
LICAPTQAPLLADFAVATVVLGPGIHSLAFTPLVFVVLMSVDVPAALAVALAFAPEVFATAAVLALLFLLGRRLVRALRHKRDVGEDRG